MSRATTARSSSAVPRADLEARADHLLRYEQERFDVRVAAAAPARGAAEQLRATVAQLTAARRAAA